MTLTSTEYLSSLVTKTHQVTLFAEPLPAVATEYVPDLTIKKKVMVYTSTSYVLETISINYSGWHVDNIYEEVWDTFTSTRYDTVTRLETSTRSSTETLTRTMSDVSTSLTYVPLVVSQTTTDVSPVYQYQTVYQQEYVMHTASVVKTETSLITVYHCWTGYMDSFFGYRK